MPKKQKIAEGLDRELVDKFAVPWERQDPEVFVGRSEELEIVELNCRRAVELCREGKKTAGHTIVFQGAPGAGKSMLLSQLVKLWEGKEEYPQFLPVSAAVLRDDTKLALEIIKKIAPGEEKRFRQNIIATGTTSGSIPGIASEEVSATRETKAEVAFFAVLKDLMPPAEWNRSLCILVDEIQNIGEDHRNCLELLHLGEHGLPIVPIYAGLADSVSALAKAGVSRLLIDNVRTIGALGLEECGAYVKQMLGLCRIPVTSDELNELAAGIAKSSEGWPQHLITETAALFWGIKRADYVWAGVDFSAVEKRAAIYREDSYRSRRSKEMKDQRCLVAAVMAAVPAIGMYQDVIHEIIERTARSDSPSWRLPKGMDSEMFLTHLLHQGALQPDRSDKWSCPIPSLRTWLIDQAPEVQSESRTS